MTGWWQSSCRAGASLSACPRDRGLAYADLEPFKDYSVSESVCSITTIKVHSNMDDPYLEGLKRTWVESHEVTGMRDITGEYNMREITLTK